MIRLKHLLRELSESDLQRCLKKIENKEFRFIAGGDNGRVYQINGEDKIFKITKEQDEYEVATQIVNQYDKFNNLNKQSKDIIDNLGDLSMCNTKLFKHQENNLIRMFNIHPCRFYYKYIKIFILLFDFHLIMNLSVYLR